MIPNKIAQNGRKYGYGNHDRVPPAYAIVIDVWLGWDELNSWTAFWTISGHGFTGKRRRDKINPTVVTKSKEAIKEYESLFQSMVPIIVIDEPSSNKRF